MQLNVPISRELNYNKITQELLKMTVISRALDKKKSVISFIIKRVLNFVKTYKV